MVKSNEIDKVIAALVAAQKEMTSATKGSANPFFKSKYADLNAIREACMPALSGHELFLAQPTVVLDGKNYIQTTIYHSSGQYVGGLTEIIHSKKDNAQDFGAGTTYARRFGLQSLLCIGVEDDDGETAVGRGKVGQSINRDKTPAEIKAAVQPKQVEQPLTSVEKQNLVEQAKSVGVEEVLAPKKGGFGVKKAEVVTTTSGTEDGWS